jgi:hypothetical protein
MYILKKYIIKRICIEKFQQFICQGKYGFKFNFVLSMDMNLLVFKFKVTMSTYKGYACSKSK